MPLLNRPLLVASALAYLAAVVAIALWSARRTRDSRDFFIAGQRLGLLVTALATASAAFSGFVFLGGPGLTYRLGAGSFFICVSVGFTPALLCWTVGRQLRELADDGEIYTIPDAFLRRYDSRLASGLAAGAVLIGTVGYLGAQLLALGLIVSALIDAPGLFGDAGPLVALGLGLAVVLFYSAIGGMVAGVYTDVLQGGLMMAGAVAVFATAWRRVGGWERATEALAGSPEFGARFLDPLGIEPATALGFFVVFAVGTLGQPHMLHKFYMLRDPGRLKWMPLALGGAQSLCLLIWIGLGLAVPALVATGQMQPLTDPDLATPTFLLHFTPDLLAGLAFAAVLAAIMSTADSFLNIGAAALVRDLPRAFGRPPLTRELAWGRVATVGLGLAAAAVAWGYGDLIALLGTFAFGTFAAALAPALAVGLNWPRVDARAAIASLTTGLVLNLGLELWSRSTLPPILPAGVLPSAVALSASFVVLFLATALRRA
ncbi:MAG: sodium:solute symporter family protein [Thermoanaerobaculia bacterium]